jgi:hypothetical protein
MLDYKPFMDEAMQSMELDMRECERAKDEQRHYILLERWRPVEREDWEYNHMIIPNVASVGDILVQLQGCEALFLLRPGKGDRFKFVSMAFSPAYLLRHGHIDASANPLETFCMV